MAHLFSDEDFPFPVVAELRRLGHDISTLGEIGRAGQALKDDVVLALAHAEGRTVLTLNRKHFIRLHLLNPNHSGIIVCTYDPDFSRQAGRIDAELRLSPVLARRLLRVNRPSS